MESIYSRRIFPLLRCVWDYTLGLSPIPLIYLFAAVTCIWFFARFRKRRGEKRQHSESDWRRRLAAFYLATAQTFGAAVCLFYFLWGFNYNRMAIEKTLALDVVPLDPEGLWVETHWAVARASEARKAIPGADEEALTKDKIPKDLESKIRHGLTEVLRSMQYPTPGRVRGRFLWPPGLLMRFGGSGIYIPYVFEGYSSSGLLPASRPFNMAHEMSHGYGFAEEGTCNFLAWLACEFSKDPAIQYSGRLAYWSSIARDFRRAFPQEYRKTWESLPEGMKADLEASAEIWRKYEGRLSRLSEKVYSGYLKSQGISEGLASYDRLILLVSSWKSANRVLDHQ